MNSESLTNVLTRQWRIVTGCKTVNTRNGCRKRARPDLWGRPWRNPGRYLATASSPLRGSLHYSVSRLSRLRSTLGRSLHFAFDGSVARSSLRSTNCKSCLCSGGKTEAVELGHPGGGGDVPTGRPRSDAKQDCHWSLYPSHQSPTGCANGH